MVIQYWRNRDRYYRLIGSKCNDCGKEYFPPVYTCKACGSQKIEDKEMPKQGKIVTYTVLHEPLPGFELMAPLYLAIIQLENGVKVLGQIVDSPPDKVRTGSKVSVSFRRMKVDGESGQIIYGYKFVVQE